jgi:hypothetical protein
MLAGPPSRHNLPTLTRALLMVDFLLGPDGQKILERFKYGSAAKDYGFKRWIPKRVSLVINMNES